MTYHPNMGITRELYNEQHVTSAYQGDVGERIEIKAKVKYQSGSLTDWGYKFYVTLEDEMNNLFFYAGSVDLGKPEQQVSIRATVTRHGLKNGKRTTYVSRPLKLVKEVS